MSTDKRMSFYEELIKRDSSMSKSASEKMDKESAKTLLDEFSTEEMERIAEELGLLEKEAAESTSIEDMVAAEEDASAEKEAAEEVPVEEKPVEEKKEETPVEEKKEEAPAAEEKPVEEKPAEEKPAEEKKAGETSDENAEENEKTAGETLDELVQEGAEAEQEIIAEAYDLALEKLASAGLTLSDYVSGKILDEKVASVVVDKAEKLAFVTERNPLMVADDIIASMYALVNTEEDSE